MHIDQNCLKLLRKLQKVMKFRKMFLIKLVSDYFSKNSRWIFGTFENQQKTLGKRFWTIFVKKIIFRQILSACSVHFHFCHVINYALTGLLMPHFKASGLVRSLHPVNPISPGRFNTFSNWEGRIPLPFITLLSLIQIKPNLVCW